MAVYAGRLDKDLREDFKHRVTVIDVPAAEEQQYDDEGRPVPGPMVEHVPALWVEKVKHVVGQDGNASIVAYVTCYLPHDMPVRVGAKIRNEDTGQELTVIQVRPPVDASDYSLPYTAWLA